MAKQTTRFAVAVHILTILEVRKNGRNTSVDLALDLGTNAAFVRRVTSMLGRAGLVEGISGVGGTRLLKSVEHITLLDVFRAVQSSKKPSGFGEFSGLGMHRLRGDGKPEGAVIHGALESLLVGVERAIEDELSLATISDVVMEVRRRLSSTKLTAGPLRIGEILQRPTAGGD